MAERYAKEAERLAELEKDEERKAELLTIAETCHACTEIPARHSGAIQSFYFYHISIFMEQNAAAYNPGRMDQYFIHITKSILKVEESQRMKDRSFWSVCG